MILFITGALIGLVVGWNILPQPEWIKKLVNKVEIIKK